MINQDKKIFLEIGACDYDTWIPLIKNGNWSGIFVEPTSHYANSLKKIAIENQLPYDSYAIEQIALSNYEGFGKMKVCLPEHGMFSRGLSHLSTSNVDHIEEFSSQNWIEEDVQIITLDNLIDKYKLTNIHTVKMDIEGGEVNVLKDYSWRIKPDIMLIEHRYSNHQDLHSILKAQGYELVLDELNVFAIKS
jgi:FkbM family methyltransferase